MSRLENRKILIDGLTELGIEPANKKVDKLIAFKEIMLEWNEKVNLTSITEERRYSSSIFLIRLPACLQDI